MEIPSVSQTVDQIERAEQLRQRRKQCIKCKRMPLWTNELHGSAQFFKAQTRHAKAFWFIMIGVCLLSALWFSRVLFTAYLEEQTVTLNTFKEVKRIQYPNLVICPKQADSLQYEKLKKDMEYHLGYINFYEFYDLLNFVIAGSGVHGMEPHLNRWGANYTEYLYDRLKIWRATRSWEQFFTFFFESHGYTCEDLFNTCMYGYTEMPCCELFRPNYVLLRGRCFRLNEFYQQDPGDMGKLQIMMNDLPSNFLKINGTQPQLVLYLSTKYGDVNLSPRLYMSKDTWNEIRYQMKQIIMLPERSQQCSNSIENMGVPRCAANAWLQQQLVQPFNCTFYPYHSRSSDHLKTCDPHTIVQNYNWIMKNHVSTTHCFPACERDDVREQKFSSTQGQSVTKITTPYMIQIQFDELRVEIYREIHSTSVPGFISELGGQVMLYLGMSINTVVQFFFLVAQWLKRQYKKIKPN